MGIGNSAPASILDVTKANTTLANIQTVVANNAMAVSSTYGAGTVYWPGFHWYTTDNNATKPKAGIWSYGDGSGSKLFFGTSNSYVTGITNSAMTIDPSGNVGVNNTGPAYKLDVTGDINFTSTVKFGGVNVLFGSNTDVYGNIRVLQNNSSATQDGMYVNYNSTGGAAAHLRFYANGTTQRMLINASTGVVTVNNLAGSGNRVVMTNPSGDLFTSTTQGYGGNIQYSYGTTDISTGSTTYADMSQMSITMTPVHSIIIVHFSCSGDVTGPSMVAAVCRLQKDGTTIYGANSQCEDFDYDDWAYGPGGYRWSSAWNMSFVVPVPVTVGVSTTIKVQWRRGGTWTNGYVIQNQPSTQPDWSNRVLFIND